MSQELRRRSKAGPQRGIRSTAGARRWSRGRNLGALAALSFVFVLLAQFHFLVPDSTGYLSYARSFLWDQDLDFENEYARFGMIDREENIEFGGETRTGRRGNPFGLGTAVIWSPFVTAAAVLGNICRLMGLQVSTDGFGTATLWSAHLGSWGCVLAAIALVAASLKQIGLAGAAARRTALLGAFLATPLVYYTLQLPSYSHAASTFVVSLLLFLSLRWRSTWNLRRSVILGAVVGLAALVRIQELGFITLAPLLGWWGGALRQPRRAILLAPYAAAAALTVAPQLLVWSRLYGSAWSLPQGEGFLQPGAERFLHVLFASRHGLLTWSPVFLLACIGWGVWLRRSQTRGLALALWVCFVAQWVLNALPIDWWAGWSFGARRFLDLVPLVALGLVPLAQQGRGARIAIHMLILVNLVQWLRVATRALSGEADPGWNGLWGSGFWSFVPQLPGALITLLRSDWTTVQILRRPSATAPSFTPDPLWFLWLCFGFWLVGLLLISWRATAASPGESREAGSP